MKTKEEVVEWLVEWLSNRVRDNRYVDNTSENYLENGWVDSFGLIELLADIEEQFDVRLNEDSFSDPRFPTVDGLGELISQASLPRKRGPRQKL